MPDSEASTQESLKELTPLEKELNEGNLVPTLAELFDKEPLELTPEERGRLIAAMRERREMWMSEEARAANAGKNPNWKSKGTSKVEDLTEAIAAADLPPIDLSVLKE